MTSQAGAAGLIDAEGFDALAQPALGARCIVFVDDAFADHRVDLRHRFLVEAGSLLGIPIGCCFLDFLDGCPHA